MARIRTVKPEMASDEALAETSIAAQLLAVRILNYADDEGYFNANPALVKAACFPLVDSVNIPELLSELSNMGYIRIGEGSDGRQYGKVRKFSEHQRVNRPYESRIKDLVTFSEHSVNDHGTFTAGKGKGKGKGKDTSESKIPACPHEEIITAWHEVMHDKPKVSLNLWRGSQDAKALELRWKENPEHQDVEWWRGLFVACRSHDFWMTQWKGFNFRWLVQKRNFIKAVEHWANEAAA